MITQFVTTAPPAEIYWHYSIPPRTDSKMQLLTIGDVAVHGNWQGELGQYFKAWCPLPKRDKALEEKLFSKPKSRF